jgi:E3 ubiquitin-protein ligase HERC3
VPIEGLKALKFSIHRHSNTANLPTAHTCFNVLMLPEYDSQEQLVRSMRLVLEHNQGFGLI